MSAAPAGSRALAGPRGYTLIELLAVIAIVGMLAALLFPVIAMVRKRAHRTACLSNLRQTGAATLMYRHDHDGLLPRAPYRLPAGVHPPPPPVVKPTSALEGYGLDPAAARCPTNPAGTPYGFQWRFELYLVGAAPGPDGGGLRARETDYHRIRPGSGSVLAYCYRHLTVGADPAGYTAGLFGGRDRREGAYLVLREDGAVSSVPAGRAAIWTYAWEDGEGTWHGPDAPAVHAGGGRVTQRFDVFPGEPWPPTFADERRGG